MVPLRLPLHSSPSPPHWLTQSSEVMDVEFEDASPCHLKALDSNIFTPLEPIDPRIQLFPGDLLQFPPSTYPDDSLPQELCLEHPHRCLDDIQDTWGFNGESPDGGSWSLESTPSLLISDLSPLRTFDDVSIPCTPNTFDALGELIMFPNTCIPLPDCRDGLKDRDQAAPSSSVLPPFLLMSLECPQVPLDPTSTTSLLLPSNNHNAEVYVQNDIQDGYQAPQPAGVNDYCIPRSSPSFGQDARAHPSPLFSPMCSPPPAAPLGPRFASAFESGWDGIQPGMVDLSSNEVDATQYYSPHSSHQSLNEVKWIGGCLPSIISLGTMGEPSYPFKHRLPVGSLAPTSSMSSMDDATTSTGYEQRRKINPFIDSQSPSRFVVPSTSYLGDACTFREGDMQRCQADPVDSPTPSLPNLPPNKRLGDSRSKKVTRTARERASSKKTSRTSRKAVPSKPMSQAPREGISHQSSSTTNPLLATCSSLPARNLESGEHESGDMDVDSSLPIFRPIGSPNIYAASKSRRKHEAKYQCTLFKEQCRATFTSEHNLINHIKCHLGLLSYCSGCEKAYKHSASKDRHEKKCERVQSQA
ncbi:hypothetical protein K443DRAFT_682277 [Laccaria amethystina LaAM-08-1]|uniref:C2H2-type domain-containing protein n=1 Tax=Laccaria amethystina LaAM-08-1 TaxID=1095629 RepID=A0A0C9XFX2_9AGAR|nr:hypothetical protein K443DRAFT_682277 [Laccaria amethystina LaAM-08-1]